MKNVPATSRQPTCVTPFIRLLAGIPVLLLLTGFTLMEPWRVSNRGSWDLNENWRFHAGDVAGAENPAFDDSAWAALDLPHDWSIAGSRRPDAPSGPGGGFVPTGVGWYRLTFNAPSARTGQAIWIDFDGVYMNAEVWLNGHRLGVQPYGYSPFRFDLTPHLKTSGDNVLAVRVDNSAQPNSRWYTGSGIYRSVRLHTADAVHIPPAGVFVLTPEASPARATVRVQTTIRNDSDKARTVRLETRIVAPSDGVVGLKSASLTVPARGEATAEQRFTVKRPALWSPESPELYTLVSRATAGSDFADVVEQNFGVRTVQISAKRGFELNGRAIKLNGANVHHDHGALGAASFADVEERRVRLLKAAGFNAVRTAHNVPSKEFLSACDRLGLLVLEDAFDGWEKPKNPADYSLFFKEWWQRDLDAMILRDRNHPSVVMWNIGNEVVEKGTPDAARLAHPLVARVRELDPTRIVTCVSNFPWHQAEWIDMDPLYAAVDLAGYNYEHNRHADDHVRVPDRVMLAAESYPADTFAVWAIAQDHPYFIGDFVWTGIDYLGEAAIGRVYPPGKPLLQFWETEVWPWYGAYCGDIDLTGWRKPISHYRNIVWDRGEKLYVAVQEPAPDEGPWQATRWAVYPSLESWTWPGQEGRTMTVEVYSRHDRVRLYLNDRQLGEKPTTRAEAFEATFEVPYEPGTLRAVGVTDGREAETFVIETAGPAVGVRLRPDWGETNFEQTMPTFLIAEIVDAQGRLVPTSNARIDFSADGAEIVAVATGDLATPESYVATSRRAWHGRAQVIVRPPKTWMTEPKDFTVTATVPELDGATTTATIAAPVILLP